jgi:hypothetical protein
VHRRQDTLAPCTHSRSPTAREAGGPRQVKLRRLSNVSQARERCYSEADACQPMVRQHATCSALSSSSDSAIATSSLTRESASL